MSIICLVYIEGDSQGCVGFVCVYVCRETRQVRRDLDHQLVHAFFHIYTAIVYTIHRCLSLASSFPHITCKQVQNTYPHTKYSYLNTETIQL